MFMKNSDGVEGGSVLVVDDEAGLRDMLVFGLRDQGYRVVTAASGEEALDKAGLERFDLAFCDIMMPGMGGVETLRGLKALHPETEVIMATGFATLETAVESMKLGAYDYITKPYDMHHLAQLLAKALERARLRSRVDQLEELNRLKSEFLSSMSHELRTPMNAVIGYTNLLLEGVYGAMPKEQQHAIGRVVKNAENLLLLINSILDLSKLQAGRMAVALEEFDLAESAEDAVMTVEPLFKEKGLYLRLESRDPVRVLGDRTKVKQVFINLLGNAHKFTDSGGVTVRLLREGDRAVFTVADTGVGMSAEEIPVIFEEFRQLDGSAARRHGGTGLGLAIVKRLVDLMNGSIEVTSTPGQGTTFSVRLPAARGLEAAPSFPAPEADAAARIVLVIDDDAEVIRIVEGSMRGSGYRMAAAMNGPEGLAMARTLKPCAITLDIMMPHVDGWSVLKALKEDPETRDIPVMILSIVDNRALAFALGADAYVVKPFRRSDLLEQLRAISGGGTRRVLVVEDDREMAEMLRLSLSREGFEAQVCFDGQQAIEVLPHFKPDLVYLDLLLPRVSGLEVLEWVRRHPALKNTRVVIATSKELTAEETAALQSMAQGVVRKGATDLRDLLGTLRDALAPAGTEAPR